MTKYAGALLAAFIILLSGCDLFLSTGSSGSSPSTYRVTYDGNGYLSGDVPVDSSIYTNGSTAIVLDNTGSLAKTEYTFEGWNTASNGSGSTYNGGDSLSVNSNITLYAQWEIDPDSDQIQGTRIFNTLDISTNSFYECEADLYVDAEGTYCQVYVERASSVTIATAQAIATEFDDNIYSQITSAFGTESDVDSNGKIILLYLDIQDGYSGSGGYVAGYFHSYHEFDTTTYAYSNEADMIFLDTYPSVAGSSSSFETVAHEFQHLINFSSTYLDDGTYQETWINEGLSSGAEYVYSGEVSQSRVDYYNADPQLSSNPGDSITYGNNFFIWGNDLEDYATVSLFFQWLRIHASNGTGIYKEILASSYRDYRAVTSAAVSRIDAQFSDWGDLLSTWMIANILDDEVELPSDYSGYLWYKDEINPVTRRFNSANNATCYLYPGERIFSTMPSENTPPGSGTNIEYAGISTDGTIDRTSPYSGDYALVFNSYSSIVNPVQETGYVANVEIPEPTLSRSNSSTYVLPESYKVDVMFNHDGTISGVGE